MKIMYYSVSPMTQSGYGRCTAELVYRLLEKFDVDIFAYYGLQDAIMDIKLGDRQTRVYGGTGDVYHPLITLRQFDYDLLLSHWDLWFVTFQMQWLEKIKLPIIWWSIIDHDPLKFPARKLINYDRFLLAVPMTEWAREVMLKCPDINPDKVGDPIPHGIDTNVWKPVRNPKIPGIPDNAEFVVVSVVANNGFRESIPVMMEAFTIFVKETGADAYFYIHANPKTKTGFNLFEVGEALNEIYGIRITDRILFKGRPERYPDEYLMNVYSRADVHLMTVMGGAFEIPILEAACCGTPTITTAFSGPGEVVGWGSRGIALEPDTYFWMNLASSRQAIVKPEKIAEALRIYYEDSKLRQKHVKKMQKWIRQNATWDIVGRKWIRLLEEVWDSLTNYGKYYYILRKIDRNEFKWFNEVNGKVLELGCGLGDLLEYLRLRGVDVEGVEISDYAIEKCREKGLRIYKADAQNLPFDDNSYDYVISQHLIEHLDDPMAVIFESLRVAKKKVIHILPGYVEMQPGVEVEKLLERAAKQISKMLIERGYKVELYPEPEEEAREKDWVLIVEKEVT